jgi:hypothetical protein
MKIIVGRVHVEKRNSLKPSYNMLCFGKEDLYGIVFIWQELKVKARCSQVLLKALLK